MEAKKKALRPLNPLQIIRKQNFANEVERIRKAAIERGEAVESDKGHAAMARLIGCNPNLIVPLLMTEPDPRRRGIGDGSAEAIERALGRPLGWLSIDHSDEGSTAPALADQIQALNITVNALIAVIASRESGEASAVRALIRGKNTPQHLLLKDPLKTLLASLDAASSDHNGRQP